MNFGCYYNAAENAPGGQIRGGFWDEDPQEAAAVKGNYCGMGADVWFTGHHYGAFNTEPRIASYLGIAAGQIPAQPLLRHLPHLPQRQLRLVLDRDQAGRRRGPTHEGVRVFEGALPYRGMHIVPTWGGSMFEALMVPLFVPEETWGPRSWGVNHPLYVRGQIEHGLDEAGYGYWGFSPVQQPRRRLPRVRRRPARHGRPGLHLRPGAHRRRPALRGLPARGLARADVVRRRRRHPARVVPGAALRPAGRAGEPAQHPRDFDAYGPGGFYDAVAVRSGTVSKRYLSLDQGMVMAALGNALAGDDMRKLRRRAARWRRRCGR